MILCCGICGRGGEGGGPSLGYYYGATLNTNFLKANFMEDLQCEDALRRAVTEAIKGASFIGSMASYDSGYREFVRTIVHEFRWSKNDVFFAIEKDLKERWDTTEREGTRFDRDELLMGCMLSLYRRCLLGS